ncbi:MAG: multiheme c-type cytochrome ExtKL [Thermodesulfovibrionales bacterium]|nr:multiheme c-type cytochrome ExtKL [Thermodesulfovibrionales bacterium]
MKVIKYLIILIFISLLYIPGTAISEEIKKAKTIDELIKRYDSTGCKTCHEKIYLEWEKSLHSRSIFGTGRTAATLRTTVINGLMEWPYSGVKKPEDVKVKHLMICMKCHLPQLEEAEDSVAQEIIKNVYAFIEGSPAESEKAEAVLKKLNINCLICHQRNAIVHKWVDGYPEKNAVYGSKDGFHPSPEHPKLKTSPIIGESIICGQCHGLGPNFELDNPSQCGTLYGSYLWSYRAEGGTEDCQDCHMRKSGLGHDMESYRSPEMQRLAVDFYVNAYGLYWRDGAKIVPQAFVEVDITNKAGHAIPDG